MVEMGIFMLLTLLYFFLALFVLIVVHEFGHFIVARWCNVKVLRFSFGFGKVLKSWRDKHGTEYAISLFPLGGYVKMLDESEGVVLESERHLAFNNKSIWARIAIVIAGPLFNFIFAFLALYLVLVIGIKSLAPMISDVKPYGIAAKAGITAKQEILSLDGEKIASWHDFQYALMPLIGSKETVIITTKPFNSLKEKSYSLPLANWHLDPENNDVLASLGIVPFIPSVPPIVGEVMDGTPAANARLYEGDVINLVDGKKISDWLELVDLVKKHPNENMKLVVIRQGKPLKIDVQIGSKMHKGKAIGYIGVRSKQVEWPENWLKTQRESPINAIGVAFKQTVNLTKATFIFIGRLVGGELSIKSLSGPVGIAEGAGQSARSGLTYYLSFLALVSISLGALNLLPIPILDGGYLLFSLVELILRRPLSEKIKLVGFYLGMILLGSLMFVAFGNDIARLS